MTCCHTKYVKKPHISCSVRIHGRAAAISVSMDAGPTGCNTTDQAQGRPAVLGQINKISILIDVEVSSLLIRDTLGSVAQRDYIHIFCVLTIIIHIQLPLTQPTNCNRHMTV
jgi:hypothetical protein